MVVQKRILTASIQDRRNNFAFNMRNQYRGNMSFKNIGQNRNVITNSIGILRYNPSYMTRNECCFKSSEFGHISTKCSQGGRFHEKCFNCVQTGHEIKNCKENSRFSNYNELTGVRIQTISFIYILS